MCDLSTRRAGGCTKRGALALVLMLGAAGGALGAPPDAGAQLSVSDSREFC